MHDDLHERVSYALSTDPMKGQKFGASVGLETPDGKKANSKAGMGNTKIKIGNAFNPNKTYTVSVINKAKAKMG